MQDADPFMELAGTAGVFVGFGALIAVRSGGTSDPPPDQGRGGRGMMNGVERL